MRKGVGRQRPGLPAVWEAVHELEVLDTRFGFAFGRLGSDPLHLLALRSQTVAGAPSDKKYLEQTPGPRVLPKRKGRGLRTGCAGQGAAGRVGL